MRNRVWQMLRKYRMFILYVVCGVLTSLANFAVYIPLYNWLDFSATLSNVIAWFIAVLVAYLMNKPLVFRSNNWSFSVVVPEFAKFMGCRALSGIFETAAIFVAVDLLGLDGNWVKVIVSIVVIIVNYIASKYFVFRNKRDAS